MCVCVHMYVPVCMWSDSSLALGTYSGLFAISSCATFEGDLTLLCVSPGTGATASSVVSPTCLHRAGHTVGCGKGPHKCSYMIYG